MPIKGNAALYAYNFDWYIAIPIIVFSSLLIMAIAIIIDIVCIRNIVSLIHPFLVKVLIFIKVHLRLVFKKRNS